MTSIRLAASQAHSAFMVAKHCSAPLAYDVHNSRAAHASSFHEIDRQAYYARAIRMQSSSQSFTCASKAAISARKLTWKLVLFSAGTLLPPSLPLLGQELCLFQEDAYSLHRLTSCRIRSANFSCISSRTVPLRRHGSDVHRCLSDGHCHSPFAFVGNGFLPSRVHHTMQLSISGIWHHRLQRWL